jgi:hypothetical protein
VPLRGQHDGLTKGGAMIGTEMKIIMASDITLAMRRPL